MISRPTGEQRIEFPYLDGLRGAAAIAVVFAHAFLNTGLTGQADSTMPLWSAIVNLGSLGVAVFIVLSGYVLTLPLLQTEPLQMRGGIAGFVKRRSRRILPPYFAALAFALILIAAVPAMQMPMGTQWDTKLPVTWGGVVSHVLLIHDLSPDWVGKINGPLWSVAVEWHIYFIMALVLVPCARKFGIPAVASLALVLSIVIAALGWAEWAHPWFVGLFASGMWAAQSTLSFSRTSVVRNLAIGLWLFVPIAVVAARVAGAESLPWLELTSGVALAATLTWAGQRTLTGRPPAVTRPLASRPMLFLGLISYSIYLFHSPALALANILILPANLPLITHYLVMTSVATSVAISFSWLMFLLVERRFLNPRQKNAERSLNEMRPGSSKPKRPVNRA